MATKTITLTGAETAVVGLDGAHAHITNWGADIIYAAKTAGITAGADGVVPIPAGNGNTLRGISGAVYLLGTGSVLVQTDDYVQHPSFRNSTASGGSGVDEVARTAINKHSGNAEIHVTAAEKSAWDGKADLSDIPASLPANGGNADTLDGFHADDFVKTSHESWVNQIQIPNDVDVPIWIADNAKLYTRYYTSYENTGLTNIAGGDPNDYVWYYFDGINIIATCNMTQKVWMTCVINGVFSGWAQINATSVGKYTEAKIAALEARIAALEGGSTT